MSTAYRNDVSWLALGSLFLGVMTFMVIPYFYVTVIPAIILAHLGFWRASKSEEPVEGRALTILGMVFNYGFILSFILVPIVLTYFDDYDKRSFGQRIQWVTTGFHSQPKSRQAQCRTQLKAIGISLLKFSSQNNGSFPGNLEQLINAPTTNDLSLRCPGNLFYQPQKQPGFQSDYTYCGQYVRDSHPNASTTILMYDTPDNHRHEWTNILFVDGHVEGYPGDDITKISRKFGFHIPKR